MAKQRNQTAVDATNSTVDIGYSGKGTPEAGTGQILISAIVGAPAASIVFGANNLERIYIRKKKAGVGYEYEACALASLDAKIGGAGGWELVSGASFPTRTISNDALATTSKVLNTKLTASVTYEWRQDIAAYTNVPAAARLALGQLDGAGATKTEVVKRASAFIFKEAYAGIPGGTLIGIKGVKARYRFSAATETSGGVYTSFADGDKV